MAPNPKDQKWYSLAKQVSTEMDQAKLMPLVNQLCAALDERIEPHAMEAYTDAPSTGGRMATTPKFSIPLFINSLAECGAERESLRCKTQAQILSTMEVIERSNALILDCTNVLTGIRSRSAESAKARSMWY